MTTILDDYLDAEFDSMASVSLNKYEANLFMTFARATLVTKHIVRALASGMRQGKYKLPSLMTNGLLREQVFDNLIKSAVRRVYTDVQIRAGNTRNPKPGRGLVTELARAYRKKAGSFASILSMVRRQLTGLMEDDGDAMWPIIRPSVRGEALFKKALKLQDTHLRVPGRANPREKDLIRPALAAVRREYDAIKRMSALTDAEDRIVKKIMNALMDRLQS